MSSRHCITESADLSTSFVYSAHQVLQNWSYSRARVRIQFVRQCNEIMRMGKVGCLVLSDARCVFGPVPEVSGVLFSSMVIGENLAVSGQEGVCLNSYNRFSKKNGNSDKNVQRALYRSQTKPHQSSLEQGACLDCGHDVDFQGKVLVFPRCRSDQAASPAQIAHPVSRAII